MTRLAPYTTLHLGGPARRVVATADENSLLAAVREADAAGEPVLVLAGGSNVVIADAGFDGTVVLVRTRGTADRGPDPDGRCRLEVAAGEDWDTFVAACVDGGLAGIEALSGIPGSVGATPIQNVGAYGQEVADVIAAVRVLDRPSGKVLVLAPEDCGFAYRTSAFKRDPGRHLVLSVTFALRPAAEGEPIRYAELAHTLGAEQAPPAAVREAVLGLRRRKGMVLDADDPDTRSAGSFFTNPIVDPAVLDAVAERAGARPPAWPQPGGAVKTSAAWLIERAGFGRGHGDALGAAISTKHTLALTNRGNATTADLLGLAREVAGGVQEAFGIALVPEPVLVGEHW